MEQSNVIENEKYHANVLEQSYPKLKSYKKKIEKKIAMGEEEFIIKTDNYVETRQYVHIMAFLNNYYSKTIMSDYDFGSRNGKCSRCRFELVSNMDRPGFCCNFCDGVCPNGCKDYYSSSSGKAWFGDIKLSKYKLKLGRKKRTRINRWRHLLMDIQK